MHSNFCEDRLQWLMQSATVWPGVKTSAKDVDFIGKDVSRILLQDSLEFGCQLLFLYKVTSHVFSLKSASNLCWVGCISCCPGEWDWILLEAWKRNRLLLCCSVLEEALRWIEKLNKKPIYCSLNLLKTKSNLLYIRNQFVPRSKHFPPRL